MSTTEASMDNGDNLPIARSSAAQAKQKLFEFIRRTGR